MFVDQLVVHREMRRQRIRAEGIRRHGPAAGIQAARFEDVVDQRRDQALVQLLVLAFHGRQEFFDKFRHRHQIGAAIRKVVLSKGPFQGFFFKKFIKKTDI